jgi:hypothetical protein
MALAGFRVEDYRLSTKEKRRVEEEYSRGRNAQLR